MRMKSRTNGQKIALHYPCRWLYKVIGSDQEELRQAIAEIVQDRSCSITPSKSSKNGRYHCLNLEVTVTSEISRNELYKKLTKHQAIKIIL